MQRESGKLVTFNQLDIKTNKAHGIFDVDTGIFVAKTTGTYRLDFNGVAYTAGRNDVQLRVNGTCKASSSCRQETETKVFTDLHGSLVISTLLELKNGDTVDIFVKEGALFEEDGGCFNRFSVVLLS